MFLDALVGQGIAGLALLAAICVLALRQAQSKWLAAAIVAGIAAQQFTAFTIPTAVLFFTAVALALPAPSSPDRAPRYALAIPVAATLLYLAFRVTAADRFLELTRRDIDAGNGQAAATHFEAFDRWRLPGAGSDLWYSRAMAVLAQRSPNQILRTQAAAQAGYAALRATTTAEDPFNAWYHAAALYATTNDAVYTERSLRAAIDAYPNWFKPHWMLARVLRIAGRNQEAAREAALAVELDGGKHKEVLDTLETSLNASFHK